MALTAPASADLGTDERGGGRGGIDTLAPADPGWVRALRPTRRTAVVVALVAVVCLAVPMPAVVPLLALAVLAGALVFDLWSALRQPLAWTRSRPAVMVRGQPEAFELTVTVVGGQSRVDRVRQPVPAELALQPGTGSGGRLEATLTGLVRGIHPLPVSVARVRGPLGLGSCDRRAHQPSAVTVFPDLPRALRLAEARRRQPDAEDGRNRARLGLGTEFESIRDYSPDDDIRQVNWPATSRVGRPLTNVYRVDENREVLLLVDSGRLMRSPIGAASRLDVALDALAVVAVAADEAGDRVGAVAFADEVLRTVQPRRRGAEPTVRSLFDLAAREVESDYDRAFQTVAGRKRSLVVLFGDIADPAASRTLLSAVPVLLRRHAVLLASSYDPDLTALVQRTPTSALEVLRAGTAAELLADRARTAALLRALGADVVEGDPSTLGPRIVRSYMRLKRQARI